jgi:hypothetical protein
MTLSPFKPVLVVFSSKHVINLDNLNFSAYLLITDKYSA